MIICDGFHIYVFNSLIGKVGADLNAKSYTLCVDCHVCYQEHQYDQK